ncbi:N-acetyltransferase [Streptomyces virginiae]|uniref:GNAT family N-acetyltransferase n=1 Tax=Streptomyces virginiae TaxID=1961 RepID=UPI00224CA02C|nr:N-acetyltransferase [Streptomyces virginiae]MCX4718693.1 N-acetyltransferase [Streptomyces virginiae]
MLIRRETPADLAAVRAVTIASSYKPHEEEPVEVMLRDALREGEDRIPELSLVAEGADGAIVGHALCSWGRIGTVRVPNLSLLGVHRDHRRRGFGTALVHAALAAADALDAPMVVVLGDPDFYGRFGFRPSTDFGIVGEEPAWEHLFQIRTLAAYAPDVQGEFIHPEPFGRV